MLYNTPIITTNSWGPDEVITEGVTGLKVSKDDAEKMPELIADAIERLIKDQELAKELAKNAHEKFFAEYSSDKVIEKLNNTIKTIIEKEKKA
jgi:colanic acid/amylovoran biosynthesis glycosyltransferase